MGFQDAVASAGPYANNLHLAHRHITTSDTSPLNFFQAGCSSWRPSNSFKALKAWQLTEKLLLLHTFNGPLSGTTQVSRYQIGKTDLDFTEARDSEWQWHQLGRMQVCTSLQTRQPCQHPPLFFTGRMPFLPPNQQRQSTEGTNWQKNITIYWPFANWTYINQLPTWFCLPNKYTRDTCAFSCIWSQLLISPPSNV